MEGMDISKLVSLIMENPELVASIKKLASETESTEEQKAEKKPDIEAEEEATEVFAKAEPTYKHSNRGKKRNDLLCAIKPYVSKKRAGAIDTMLSVFDIIDLLSVR